MNSQTLNTEPQCGEAATKVSGEYAATCRETPKASHRVAGGRARFWRGAPGFSAINGRHPEGVP